MRTPFFSMLLLTVCVASGQNVSIAFTKFNIAYVGLQNPLDIVVENYLQEKLRVTCEGNCEIKIKDGKYYLNAKERGRASVCVDVKENDTFRRIKCIDVRLRNIPKPEVKLGTLEGGTWRKAVVIANASRINAFMGSGFAYENISCEIDSFRYFILSPSGFTAGFINGNAANMEMLYAISYPGFVYLYDVDGTYYEMDSSSKTKVASVTLDAIKINVTENQQFLADLPTHFNSSSNKELTEIIDLPTISSDGNKIKGGQYDFFLGGNLLYRFIYQDNVVQKYEWYHNGNILAEISYGKKCVYREYHNNGKLKTIASFTLREAFAYGGIRDHYASEDPAFYIVNPGNIFSDSCIRFYDNGVRRSEGVFSLTRDSSNQWPCGMSDAHECNVTVKTGTWNYYDTDGKLTMRIIYNTNGTELSRKEFKD